MASYPMSLHIGSLKAPAESAQLYAVQLVSPLFQQLNELAHAGRDSQCNTAGLPLLSVDGQPVNHTGIMAHFGLGALPRGGSFVAMPSGLPLPSLPQQT